MPQTSARSRRPSADNASRITQTCRDRLMRSPPRYSSTQSSGNLQFPLDEPMPLDLIERILKLRVKQDEAKAAAKRKKRK